MAENPQGSTPHGPFEDLLEKRLQKRRRQARRGGDENATLNINSMMDIMTIMLVFLLISITTDPLAIKENKLLKISTAASNFPAHQSIVVEINKEAILVNQKESLKITCRTQEGSKCTDEDYKTANTRFSIDRIHKEHMKKDSLVIVPLKSALEKAVGEMKESLENPDLKDEDRKKTERMKTVATIIVDMDIPFRMIAEVVFTAGMAELNDMRFAVKYSGGG